MKVFLKKKKPFGVHDVGVGQRRGDTPMETAAKVKAVLAQLSGKNFTVLAKVASESQEGKFYDIRMGSNHAVFCVCKGWQYSKDGTCKHLEKFKRVHKPVTIS